MTVSIADPQIGVAELDRLLDTAVSGQLADGPNVRAFEAAVADYCGVSHGVATTNGTTALHAALHALGIGPGDRVVTTPFSFVATANAIRLCGAPPVLADVDPETLNLDPTAVRAAIDGCDGGVDAILAVHLYGLPAPMTALRAIADEHDVPLVEDAAQAHGASLRGEPVGSLGDAACFSFYPTKNMTTGEGGMVLTDDTALAERLRRFVNHGRTDAYVHGEVGQNYRLTGLGAAIGQAQIDRLDDFVAVRRRNAARYDEVLDDHPSVSAPPDPTGSRHAYHQYTVQTDRRDTLREHLADEGIGTGVYYPRPIHRQPAYADVSATAPNAERAADRVLSVPVHPALSRDEVDRVADGLAGFEA
ncbi:DegT/DnrJ/EryC1/StrS family aminotransferase [Halorubrum sp. AD140]|uniref:DegT/DnrJ/EryC1/StrS family aminotransferase n=1 Tax=Halorubrum sp. AD140 TaxID=3050073 RepID=UPI002ACC5993|nr:DegT/DnrJ/EryC1/StrS family aminotransferase [Halorubrum sp. AD140]MDZ5810238.1 DegT/DnrJ/EryC1/StrS family aminotransferase [Halorubrum sp. AD140]